MAAACRTSSATASARCLGRVDDDLVVQEEHQVRPLLHPPAAEPPQPVPQVGEPAQRPLRAGALDDEVAGEAPPGPAAAVAVLLGPGLLGRLAQVDRPLRPLARRQRRATAEQGVHHLAPLPRPGRLLDEPDGPGVAAGQPRHHPPALAAGAAVHRPEHPDLGVGPARHRPARDHALVEVRRPGGVGHRRVTAHAGEDAGLELGDVGDDEPPAVVGDRRGPHLGRHRQRSPAVGRPPPGHHAAGQEPRPEAAVAHPGVQPVPAVVREQPVQLLVLEQGRDAGVVELLERPGPRVAHLQARRLERAQQLGR